MTTEQTEVQKARALADAVAKRMRRRYAYLRQWVAAHFITVNGNFWT